MQHLSVSLCLSLTVDGFWSGWSSWGECSSSCIPQGHAPVRTRRRSCSNPAPSSSPPGRRCEGVDRQTETCDHLPYCPGTPVCPSHLSPSTNKMASAAAPFSGVSTAPRCPHRDDNSVCLSVCASGRSLGVLVFLHFLSCYLWGGASGVDQAL